MPIQRKKTWIEVLLEEEAIWLREEEERNQMARELVEGDLFAALYRRLEQLRNATTGPT